MRASRLLLLALALVACAKSSKNEKPITRPTIDGRLTCAPAAFRAAKDDIPRLQPSETCPKFVGYLIAALTEQAVRGGNVAVLDGGMEGVPTADSADKGPVGYSRTNVQEAGVDEADIVKTDGKHIYLLHGTTLKVLKSWPPTEAAVASSLALEGAPLSMLLHQSRLAIVSAGGENAVVDDGFGGKSPSSTEFALLLTIVNVGDPEAPVIERTIGMDLGYLDARLVNGRLLLAGYATLASPLADVAVYQAAAARDDEGTIRNAIASAVTMTTFGDWLPTMRDSLTGERELMVDDFDALYVPTVTGTVGATAIVSLDLAHDGAALNKVVLAAEGGMLYATTDALYLAYADRWWWWGDGADAKTYLHRLALNDEAVPHYTGSVTVPGWIDTPFWMSEYDKHLRIVTSAGGLHRLRTYAVGNADPVFKAEVKGFAPDEAVTGVRFMGTRAYVSTAIIQINFAKDPFFTFDLADPDKPMLMGALDMPGYTTYIHPLNDDYVLAVGMFAATMADPVTAVQVQTFDVRDFAHPVTASQHVFTANNEGISFSEALNSHHAFTFYEPQGIFALPLQNFSGSWSTAFNGLVAMKVAADGSLTELGRVNHYGLGSDGYWASDVRRAVVMEGGDGKTYLYSISGIGLVVSDTADFSAPLDVVKLPAAIYP